jgi:hypothetical protein
MADHSPIDRLLGPVHETEPTSHAVVDGVAGGDPPADVAELLRRHPQVARAARAGLDEIARLEAHPAAPVADPAMPRAAGSTLAPTPAARPGGRRRAFAVAAGLIGGLVVLGGLGSYLYVSGQAAERAAEAARVEKEEIERANHQFKAEATRIQADLDRRLAAAKSAEDIAKAKAEMEAATKEAEDRRVARARAARVRRAGAARPAGFSVRGISSSDDALGGVRGK